MRNTFFVNDAPIISEQEDIFNYKHYARKVNDLIQKNSANTDPITIGIYGKWGEGKTSFLNLIEKNLSCFNSDDSSKRILKYYFNPWRYSTEDEMLFDFFEGLSRTLLIEENTSLKTAGKYITSFSRYLKAIKLSASVGIPKLTTTEITFEPSEIFQALGEDLSGRQPSLNSIKAKIDTELEQSNYKVAIIVDDIDRLDKNEIYTLLKIIKLNANFKNLVYIISLDPDYVAKAIHSRYGDDKSDGKLFLEKIINIPILLPRIEKDDLQLFFDKKISDLSKMLSLDKDHEFREIAFEFKRFQFSTPREIIRVINSFTLGAFAIGEEVNLRDLFWLEYLKITDETCYNHLKNYDDDLSGLSTLSGIIDFTDEGNFETCTTFRDLLYKTYPRSKNIIDHLFPLSNNAVFSVRLDEKELKKNLRINSNVHFEKYFSYHTIRKISEKEIKLLKNLIVDKKYNDTSELIKNLFQRHAEYQTLFKIEEILDDLPEESLLFFSELIFQKLEIVPDLGEDLFGKSFRIRIVEKIATCLRDISNIENFIISIGSNLSLFHLCYFTRNFLEEKHIARLRRLIVEKVKEEKSIFYENPRNITNKMVMQIWKEENEVEFKEFIKSTLNEGNILLLIRNFSSYWNNAYFGSLTKKNYDFLKDILDSNFIYTKLNELQENLCRYSNDINRILADEDDEDDETTVEQNALQFLHWYNLDLLNND